MTHGSDNRPVVYYYADAAFAWDLGPAVADVERRGFRVVKGDNADELLFLLQMGRPAAIVYEISSPQARSYGSFQMVSRRAIDMLVPMVVVGPDDPRDGVLLRYPRGSDVEESHLPLHAIGDLFSEFDAAPPSTPSRPAPFVHSQTFGKGRTMMSWRRSVPPPAPEPEQPPEQPPEPIPHGPAPFVVFPTTPPREEPAFEAAPEPEPRNAAPRPKTARILAATAGGVAIGMAALTVYFFTSPERPHPSAARPSAPQPSTAPTLPPEPAGPIDGGVEAGGKAGGWHSRRPHPAPAHGSEGALLSDASGTIRFPGHFRDASAIFWFAGDWEERRFLDLLRSLGPKTRIRLTGHTTQEEANGGPPLLAVGRARAVEKYLVRHGLAEERITAEGGAPVRTASDVDARGWPRNRWVDVKFE
jgi:hypothetical protein